MKSTLILDKNMSFMEWSKKKNENYKALNGKATNVMNMDKESPITLGELQRYPILLNCIACAQFVK
jgi:DNA-binding Xre family transcriptional regulator